MNQTTGPASFGRVADDGTVYVLTGDGERPVGQIPAATPEDALAFYVRRFETLEVEVSLLEQRISAGALSPEEAKKSVNAAIANVNGANAVGDLAGLTQRLEALQPLISEQSDARKAERVRLQEEAKAAKERMVAEAERISQGSDWRGGVNNLRSLLEEWKVLPRIDRATDDALWHRFSSARTTYTRRRKAFFTEQNAKRDASREAKEQILNEARELAHSTQWGPTAGAFRELMNRWKAAGAAQREVDDQLWTEFRALQDTFFGARQAVFESQDAEQTENLSRKEGLLAAAEAEILPVSDVNTARSAFRTFLEQYNQVGRVPREQIRSLDTRVKSIENAIRNAEEDEWRRTDPEARSRAEDTVAMLTAEIEKLRQKIVKAEARGDQSAVDKANESIATYQTWLDQAKTTLAEFA
ncbi:MAG: DUF349 domain-containing protein [Propionibacteriaceae bacterium]|jgi:hypothetical protein|nr:DUF349 domain-containing protein [Propionibacteriaceae bacterium]